MPCSSQAHDAASCVKLVNVPRQMVILKAASLHPSFRLETESPCPLLV